MQWVPLSSSNLSAVAYDDASSTLYIRFHHGGTYAYASVPRTLYDGLLAAGSKGQYFHTYIKDRFSFQRM